MLHSRPVDDQRGDDRRTDVQGKGGFTWSQLKRTAVSGLLLRGLLVPFLSGAAGASVLTPFSARVLAATDDS